MLGFSRKERNTKLMQNLALAYDDRVYVALAAKHKVEPVSLKQAAINLHVQQPMKELPTRKKGRYTRPDLSIAEMLVDGIKLSLEAELERVRFKRDRVTPLNATLQNKLQPQLDLLEMIATGKDEITQDHQRRLSLGFETEIEEVNVADRTYYYEPKQQLWIYGNGGKFQVV